MLQQLHRVHESKRHAPDCAHLLPCSAHAPLGQPAVYQKKGCWRPAAVITGPIHGCFSDKNPAAVAPHEHSSHVQEELLQLPAGYLDSSGWTGDYDAMWWPSTDVLLNPYAELTQYVTMVSIRWALRHDRMKQNLFIASQCAEDSLTLRDYLMLHNHITSCNHIRLRDYRTAIDTMQLTDPNWFIWILPGLPITTAAFPAPVVLLLLLFNPHTSRVG